MENFSLQNQVNSLEMTVKVGVYVGIFYCLDMMKLVCTTIFVQICTKVTMNPSALQS